MARTKRDASKETAADSPSQTLQNPSESIAVHDVARRAYDLYLARGREHGHDVQDWLQAERELQHTPLSNA
jgi:DUF2934 family protein